MVGILFKELNFIRATKRKAEGIKVVEQLTKLACFNR